MFKWDIGSVLIVILWLYCYREEWHCKRRCAYIYASVTSLRKIYTSTRRPTAHHVLCAPPPVQREWHQLRGHKLCRRNIAAVCECQTYTTRWRGHKARAIGTQLQEEIDGYINRVNPNFLPCDFVYAYTYYHTCAYNSIRFDKFLADLGSTFGTIDRFAPTLYSTDIWKSVSDLLVPDIQEARRRYCHHGEQYYCCDSMCAENKIKITHRF